MDSATSVTPGFLAAPTRFLFFTGKGGVGKTSLSAAAAIALADDGLLDVEGEDPRGGHGTGTNSAQPWRRR